MSEALKNQVPEYPLLYLVGGNKQPGIYIDENTQKTFTSILADYSASGFEKEAWIFPVNGGVKTVGIHFEKMTAYLDPEELKLTKAFIIQTISHFASPKAGVDQLKRMDYLFRFLHEKHFIITMLSTRVLLMYRAWLDNKPELRDKEEKKRKIESVFWTLLPFLHGLGLLRDERIAVPRKRKVKRSAAVCAPEKRVVHELDKYFLNQKNLIPPVFRCAYLIARFLPERDDEILNIPLDCIGVAGDLTVLTIPTRKETANHEFLYQKYGLMTNGKYHQYLIKAILEQQKFAIDNQDKLRKNAYRDHLMVSNSSPTRLVTPDEINKYIQSVCTELCLTDSDGHPAKLTLYSLRHFNGVALTHDATLPAGMPSMLFSHFNDDSMDPYSYPAPNDAFEENKGFLDDLLASITGNTNTVDESDLPF